MAILCMSEDFKDLKKRLGNIFVGFTFDRKPVYARDLKAENAMAILLKDAIKPNLVQTLENNPAIIHGGPFANIAQGTNTIIATKIGLSLADYVVTEAGFGADLGAEKFMDIKCVSGKLKPSIVVIVATIRALRHHGGARAEEYNTPDLDKVKKGIDNLIKHIENIKKFGITPVIAINRFPSDTENETQDVIRKCKELGVEAVVAEEWAKGGEGMKEIAQVVVDQIAKGENKFKPLYEWKIPIIEKIEKIAREIYGADGVDFSHKAVSDLKTVTKLGLDHLPVCMAKTQKSLSDNEKAVGRPKDFRITVREFEYSVGAGFIIPILGDMMRMPGLPPVPASEGMLIDKDGKISGLS